MIGICIEAGLDCPACDSFVPINAMVPEIRCPSCTKRISLAAENWSTLLGEAMKSAPYYEENEGSKMTIFGSFSFKVTYGRQSPRYRDTKEAIPERELLGSIGNGFVRHPVSGDETPVRPLPDEYSEICPGILALVGEDTSQISGREEGEEIGGGVSGPVAFQCPSCGGSLILDGKSRKTRCSFCDTDVYLPDDLWFALHPVMTTRRWYLLLDENRRPLDWEREVWDAARDSRGNFYVVLDSERTDGPLLASTNPDRTLRWKRTDLSIEPITTRGEPKLALAGDDRLLVASSDRTKLFILSTSDGSTLKVLDEPDSPSGSRDTYFSMKGCYDFGVFPNGTIFLYRDCDRKDPHGSYMNFQRCDMDGNLLELWDRARMTFTFMQKVKRLFSSNADPSEFDHTPSYPTGTREFDINLSIGPDGCLYMLEHRTLLKLDPDGKKVYLIEELPCNYTTGRPSANGDGEAFVVADQDNDRTEVLRVSSDGLSIDTVVRSEKDGGQLERNGILSISPGGGLNLIGYGGYWADLEIRP